MSYLLAVSLVWAFSFGLIGNVLKGVDPHFLAACRLGLAGLVFVPWLRVREVPAGLALRYVAVGAIQYGLMYVALFRSYAFLRSHEVALFTVLTPIYVAMCHDLLARRFHPLFLASAALAVAGTAWAKHVELQSPGYRTGFWLMQASNLAFAFGQVAYVRLRRAHPRPADRSVFALLYLGGLLVAAAAWAAWMPPAPPVPTARQWGVVLYLGVVASGVAFFLWNLGATRTNAGALAVFNNLKIPLAVTVSLLFFGEKPDLPRLAAGGAVCLLALALNEWGVRRGLARDAPAPRAPGGGED